LPEDCEDPLRVAITTLGCKANRADADALLERLGAAVTEVPFDGEADLYVVNTCTVTATADRQSRQMVYRARRRSPAASVVLTGCLARIDREAAARLGVDRVFTLDEHEELVAYARGLRSSGAVPASAPARRARPFLKIQDGCDSRCSYCIVPRARGHSRSDAPPRVRERLERLRHLGFAEVVLTGIHLGLYGRDLDPATSLTALLRELLVDDVGPRLRLSSVEPMELDAALVELVARSPRLCPHLHIPIQSGDDRILAAMHRPYTSASIRDVLAALRARVPSAGVGADLIAGFPGETDAEFLGTLRLVEESALTHLHVFPFSPRPGTPAAALPGRVPDGQLRARARALREAGRRKLVAFAAAQVGAERAVLVERWRDGDRLAGLTENYLRVELDGPRSCVGQIVRVRIESAVGPLLRGRPLDRSGFASA
jgi:threonylcarbamoyladenosine tRNA methylthiotransferase MtaB